jgi:hypothetical protein
MKTTTTLMVLSIGTLGLAACSNVKEIAGEKVNCPWKPSSKIKADEGELVIDDKKIPVCRTDSVVLTFKNPQPRASTARTLPKMPNGAATRWLENTYDGNAITITVPEGTAKGEYGYIIEVDGIGKLDPRLVVQ